MLKGALPRISGGLLLLSDHNCGPIQSPDLLCRDIWMECAGHSFSGVVADFELPCSQDRLQFLQQLSQLLTRNNRRLFVPEVYGKDIHQASVYICTAISGGCLRERLEEARQCFGNRLTLDLQRLRMSFPLPCPGGEGCPMTQEELQNLLEQQQPSIFYSKDLCAKYFTYPCDGELRFVLFDDGETLQKKIRLGSELGIQTGFLMYPEVEDLLPYLFRQ